MDWGDVNAFIGANGLGGGVESGWRGLWMEGMFGGLRGRMIGDCDLCTEYGWEAGGLILERFEILI